MERDSNEKTTHSEGSLRINVSMAAENAANARPPVNTPLGPEERASIPPEMNPEEIEL